MSWAPLKTPLTDLLTTYARLERLKLIEKIKAAELHLRAIGVDTTPFSKMRRTLLANPLGSSKRVGDILVDSPLPPDPHKALKHLRVEE